MQHADRHRKPALPSLLGGLASALLWAESVELREQTELSDERVDGGRTIWLQPPNHFSGIIRARSSNQRPNNSVRLSPR